MLHAKLGLLGVLGLIAACGDGDPADATGTRGRDGPQGLAVSAPEPRDGTARRRVLAAATGAQAQEAVTPDQLFNWAQQNFPQLFPLHAQTQAQGPWAFRAYFEAGTLLGMKEGAVYVAGGPFGAAPRRVGMAADFIAPARPVSRNSDVNKAMSTEYQVPNPQDIVGAAPRADELEVYSQRMAFADFFQDGSWSAVVAKWRRDGTLFPDRNPGVPDTGNRIYFLKKGADGAWHDRTAQLLDEAERTVCISVSGIEVSDLNNDGRPDAVLACTGIDFALPEGVDSRPYGLSHQWILLSQPDGRYRRLLVPTASPVKPHDDPGSRGAIYAHSAAVADFDRDGNADIVYVDPGGNGTPFVMWGRGDGSFRQDMTRFPADMKDKPIWTVRTLTVDGAALLAVSGNHPGSNKVAFAIPERMEYGTRIMRYDGSAFVVVDDLTRRTPPPVGGRFPFSFAIDLIRAQGHYYAYFVDADYAQHAVVRIPVGGGMGVIVANKDNPAIAGGSGMISIVDNAIVNVTAGCSAISLTPGDWMNFACTMKAPL